MVSYSADCVAEPFKTRLSAYLRWSLALTLLFLLTYGFTNWAAAMRPTRIRLYFDWELAIPFVPWMIWIYLSLPVFLALPLFVLDTAGISRLGRTFALATVAAAAIHLALPSDLGWPRPPAVPGYPIFDRFLTIDRPHNLVPSLHIGYGALTFMAIQSGTQRIWIKLLSTAWLAWLVCSVSLVHQHHLADTTSGLALAALCNRCFRAGRQSARLGSRKPALVP